MNLFAKTVKLSTPHGRLGTFVVKEEEGQSLILSTPHGRLGTLKSIEIIARMDEDFQLHTVD